MTPRRIAEVAILLAASSWAHRPEADEHLRLEARDRSGYSVHPGGHFIKDHKHDHRASANHKSHKHHTSHKTANLLQTQESERPSPEEILKAQQEQIEKGALKGPKAGLNEAGAKATADDDYPDLGTATCGKEVQGGHRCPAACAYAAESESKQCHFKCVAAASCGTQGTNRNNTIPDEKMKLCRHCDVEGCLTCQPGKPGEDKEFCVKCMPGYYAVDKDGDGLTEECRSWTIYIFVSIAVGAAIGMACGLLWFCELRGRTVVNEEGLAYGLECRARSKVRQPENTLASEQEDGIGPRLLYPFNTNLCTTNVAGPGNMLFFRFQAATLIWAITLTAVWCMMVLYIDSNLFSLGLKTAATPQQMCYVVSMGRRLQMKYLWVKVYWLVFAYLFSFIGAIAYAVNSMRLFQHLDNEHTTMADFVAICRSVPKMRGDEKPEELIKECIEKETGEKVVGVSVCWDFHGKKKEVTEALEQDVGSLEHAGALNNKRFSQHPSLGNAEPGMDHEAESEPGCLTSWMDKINNSTLEKWHCHFHEHEGEKSEEEKANEITEMLKGLETSELAFVVFETEDARDKAVAGGASEPRAIPMPTTERPDGGFFLEEEKHEPESCCWEHFNISETEIAVNVGKGVCWMTISLVAWTGLLYMPYAHYMGSFSFANGDEPGEMSEGIFVGLVVAAQIGLFVVASMASHNAGFSFEDDKQRIYIVLYNSALIVNLILDMSLTAYLAYHQMCGRGVRVSDGRLLADIPTLQEIIESYPMQKAIGNNLFKYCWPATFFIPFFAEPFAAQVGPYFVGKFMVRSNKKMKGENAEKALELSEAEQGRYADVMFNAILVSAVPFIAPGYILKTFSALIFSHLYIYCYDHWRVLRCCTRFWFASDTVSVFSQKIFAVPCGILLAALVFKGNQMAGAQDGNTSLGAGPLTGTALFGTMAAALFGHMFIHWLVLDYVVPNFPGPDNVNAVETYDVCAKSTPCTWFSSNPVHCLRSKYIFKHDPPQVFYVLGKEHLQKANAAIGSHYTTDEDLKKKETFKLDEGL